MNALREIVSTRKHPDGRVVSQKVLDICKDGGPHQVILLAYPAAPNIVRRARSLGFDFEDHPELIDLALLWESKP